MYIKFSLYMYNKMKTSSRGEILMDRLREKPSV